MSKQLLVIVGAILLAFTALFILEKFESSTTPTIARLAWAAPANQISPDVIAIDPVSAPNDLDIPVVITGVNFTAEMSGTLVITSPTAYLGSAALGQVTWVNSSSLSATVLWGLDPGVYTLTVVNPEGGTGSLTNAFTVTQGIGQWNGGNLFGGSVSQILLKPGDPNTMYAVGGVGLFRSRDAGETWRFIRGGALIDNGFVVDPYHPSRLYASRYWELCGSGICRSDDEGDTWTVVLDQDGLALRGGQIYISPHTAQLSFYSSATNGLGLLRSTDDGASWHIVSDMEGIYVRTLDFNPYNSQKMVLGTGDGRVFQSTDGGTHWNSVTKPPIDDIGIVTYNPFVASGEVWVSGAQVPGSPGIVKSVDSTFTAWVDVAPTSGANADSIDFTSATSVYLAGHWSGVVYHSNDDGVSWQPFGTSTSAYDIAFTQSYSNVMYLGDTQYGIQKTTDGGQTWEVKNQGISAMIAGSIAASPGDMRRVYAIFGGWPGIFRSSDSAATWQFIPVEKNAGNLHRVRVDPFDSQRVYLTADAGFYTSVDGGLTWAPSDGSHSYSGGPYAFQPDPHQKGHFLVGTADFSSGSHGALYVSTDFGQTWEPVIVAPDLKAVRDIAFDPLHLGVVYLASDGGTYRSQDHGYTWERIASEYAQMQNTFSIAIATHPQPMVIVGGSGGGGGNNSYRSLDGGDTWVKVGCPTGGLLDRLLFVDGDSSRFYAAINVSTREGLYLSVDGGQTCTPASGALGRLIVTALAYSGSGDHTILYAATTGGDLGATSSMGVDTPQKSLATENNLVEAGIYRYVQHTTQTFLPIIQRRR